MSQDKLKNAIKRMLSGPYESIFYNDPGIKFMKVDDGYIITWGKNRINHRIKAPKIPLCFYNDPKNPDAESNWKSWLSSAIFSNSHGGDKWREFEVNNYCGDGNCDSEFQQEQIKKGMCDNPLFEFKKKDGTI